MSKEALAYYNKCPECNQDRSLVEYDYVDMVKKELGCGVKCESCKSRWKTAKILASAQRKSKLTRSHLALVD